VAWISRHVACQISHPSLPFVVLAASMFAAWAEQPDYLIASVGEVARQIALILGRMPPGLDDMVLRVC